MSAQKIEESNNIQYAYFIVNLSATNNYKTLHVHGSILTSEFFKEKYKLYPIYMQKLISIHNELSDAKNTALEAYKKSLKSKEYSYGESHFFNIENIENYLEEYFVKNNVDSLYNGTFGISSASLQED